MQTFIHQKNLELTVRGLPRRRTPRSVSCLPSSWQKRKRKTGKKAARRGSGSHPTHPPERIAKRAKNVTSFSIAFEGL